LSNGSTFPWLWFSWPCLSVHHIGSKLILAMGVLSSRCMAGHEFRVRERAPSVAALALDMVHRRAIADRKTGVGVRPIDRDPSELTNPRPTRQMRISNPDGCEAEACGNANPLPSPAADCRSGATFGDPALISVLLDPSRQPCGLVERRHGAGAPHWRDTSHCSRNATPERPPSRSAP